MSPSSYDIVYRRLLLIAGSVYLLWWFAVHWLLPGAFNPFVSRFAVVALIVSIFALSYFSSRVRRNLGPLFEASVCLITLHFFYLFYENNSDINWIVGSFITVTAISFCFFTSRPLLLYSLFVLALSSWLVYMKPELRTSVFLPGVATMLAQANVGLRSRLSILKNLAETKERFQLLFNSTFEGILVHERGRILEVNESLVRLLGYSSGELVGMELLDLVHADSRALVTERIDTTQVPPYQVRAVKKDGSLIDVEVRAKSFERPGRITKLVTIHDLTDRKKAEEENIRVRTLSENVRVRDDFISIASHELKTPISALDLQIQLIKRELKKGIALTPEKFDGMIQLFSRNVSRLAELVNTMLDVSRISSGRLVLELKTTDLRPLLEEVVTLLQPSDARIQLDSPSTLTGLLDKSRIKQVVENLVGNALKYGSGRPILVNAWSADGAAHFSVSDQGPGIAAEDLGRIFDRFERAVSHQHISGLGLGLFISKQIVEAHGGRLSVASTLGAGSTFTVTLPATS